MTTKFGLVRNRSLTNARPDCEGDDTDLVGEKIGPVPVDRPPGRRASTAVVAALPEGISPLQRERVQKTARKATLQAVSASTLVLLIQYPI